MAKIKSAVGDLTEEQRNAIQDYAQFMGNGWKEKLASDWMNGYRTARTYGWKGETAHLQQIRNKFGPSWLKNLVL